jgi:lauroyl/myristoyl acyltransferase
MRLGYGERNDSGAYMDKLIMTGRNKEQGKVVPAHTTKACANGGVNPLISNLGTGRG